MEYSVILSTLVQHLIHQPVLDRIFGTQKIVTIGITLDRFDRLAGVLRQHLIEPLLQIQDLSGMNFDIRSLSTER